MKKRLVCCAAVLCMVLSGCAGDRQERPEAELPEADVRQEASDGGSADPASAAGPEKEAEDDAFSGRWQAVETPQYFMEIAKGEGDVYTLEIVWAGASRGNIVWQASGSYDETWEGVAYVGTKYEDVVSQDGSVDRLPVPEREEVTGMVYLEEDGTLCWIDDFDHAGDDLRFQRE